MFMKSKFTTHDLVHSLGGDQAKGRTNNKRLGGPDGKLVENAALTSQGIVAVTDKLREITALVSAERGAAKVETKEGTIYLSLPWDGGGHEQANAMQTMGRPPVASSKVTPEL